MTKLRNRIVLVLLALCLVVFAGVMVACGGDKKSGSSTANYTVTVKADGAAASGVKVTVKKGSASVGSKTTGADGKATFKLAKDKGYSVTLSDLPDGYEVPEGATLTFGAGYELTVNLAETFVYKVKLVKENGDPFYAEGVTVGICLADGNCLEPVAIDTTGLAKIEAAKNDYHIQILGLPAGYAYEADSNGYSMHQNRNGEYIMHGDGNTYNSLSATVNEMTITVYQVNHLDLTSMTKLTDEQIEEYAEEHYLEIDGGAAYKVTATVPAGSTLYYSFTSAYNGNYTIYRVGYGTDFYVNDSFMLEDNGNYYWSGPIATTVGNTYYVNIVNYNNEEDVDIEFIIATPSASYAKLTAAGTVEVTLYKAQASAVIEFAPATFGAAFKATVQGAATAKVGYYGYDDYSVKNMWQYLEDEDYVADSNTSFKLTQSMATYEKVYLGVSVKAASYPATVAVKLEKLRDIEDVYNVIETEDSLATYAAPSGKELVPVPLDGSADVVKGADGYYHLNDENGPIVMVVLTKNLDIDRFSFGGAVAYIELASNFQLNPYIVNVTSDEDMSDLTKGDTFDDYRYVLRGFKDYVYDEANNAKVPTNITYSKDYYAKYVNADGAYPLNDELKDILEILEYQLYGAVSSWMFACYYYDDFVEPDVIAGEYKFVKTMEADGWGRKVGDETTIGYDEETEEPIRGSLTMDEYKLMVDKRGTFAIYQLSREGGYQLIWEYGSGVWSKSGDTYTFTVPDGNNYWDDDSNDWVYEDYIYTVIFNAASGRIILTGSDDTVWIFQKGGENEIVKVLEDDDGEIMLELYDNDTFKLYEGYNLVASGTHVPGANGSIAISVTSGTATISYANGMYTVKIGNNEYEIDPVEHETIYSEDGKAKMKTYFDERTYEMTVRFFVETDGEWVQIAYCAIDADLQNQTYAVSEYYEKADYVKSVEIIMDGEDEAVKVKVTNTDDTSVTYVFEM
ncbi:MAG: hypothetical protein J1F71_05505 [Clostridiales bacterium]|nr:hypothetical protein [Clostridiales bacterium]